MLVWTRVDLTTGIAEFDDIKMPVGKIWSSYLFLQKNLLHQTFSKVATIITIIINQKMSNCPLTVEHGPPMVGNDLPAISRYQGAIQCNNIQCSDINYKPKSILVRECFCCALVIKSI